MSCEYCMNEKVLHTETYPCVCDVEVFLTNEYLEVNACNHKTPYTEEIAFNFIVNFCPNCGEPLTQPEPLTLEQLQKMDGEPVWVKGIDEWAIVIVDSSGGWEGKPFVKGKLFNFDVGARKLECYSRKPAERQEGYV